MVFSLNGTQHHVDMCNIYKNVMLSIALFIFMLSVLDFIIISSAMLNVAVLNVLLFKQCWELCWVIHFFNAIVQSVAFFNISLAKCRFVECRYAECRDA